MSFFNNQNGWPLVPLKDVATLQRGYDLPVNNRVEGNIPVYAANGLLGYHNKSKALGPGVVTGRSGTIGKVHFVDGDYWPLNTSLYVKNFHDNNPKWVFYMLQAFKLERFTEGAGVPTLNRNLVHDEMIPLPSLPEQRRIAAILDKADAIRRKRQQAIRLTEDFLRSVFLDMFGDPVTNPKGWPIQTIGSVLQSIDSGWSANGEDRLRQPDEWAVLKISSVTSGRFIPNEYKVVLEESISRKLVIPKRGDLLFSRANTRELVAATCIVENDEERLFLPDKLWKITPDKNKVYSEYLKYLLSHPRYRENFTKQATGTSGSMLNVSMAKLRGLEMPVPPIDLQIRFADIFWKVINLNSNVSMSRTEIDTLNNSLIQRAFRGGL